MKIVIEIIPYKEQRYPTCGDWYKDKDGNIQIKVNEMGDINKSAFVAIHELIEMLLCTQRNITEKQVTDFDLMFEHERSKGIHGIDDEPGSDLRSPYYKEHQFAMNIERMLCHESGFKWDEYDKTVLDSCK